MKKAIKIFNNVEEKFLAYTFIIMIVIVFTQVIFRLSGHANSWSEELARYIYIWESWVGLSYCQRYHEHIRIVAVLEALPPLGKKILEFIVILLSGTVAAVLAYLGIRMVYYLYELGTFSAYLSIPNWIIYAALPVGCVGYIIRLLIDAYILITGRDVTA